MLSIHELVRRGDGRISRRHLITAGALGAGGLTLARLFSLENAAGLGCSEKAVIHVHLDGGPPQLDTIDPKPDAPAEVRGAFRTIPTAIPGFRVTEVLPRIAERAGRFVFIRSLTGADGRHDAFQCQSGFKTRDLESIGGRPAMGCVVAKLLGSESREAPPFVDLMQGRPLVRDSARPGFLGAAFRPFRPDISQLFPRPLEEGMKKELAALGEQHSLRLELDGELTVSRLEKRVELLERLDGFRRDADRAGEMAAIDRFTRQALGVLTSGRLARALDLEAEDPRVLERYRLPETPGGAQSVTSEGPSATRKFLLARRLVEAGVRCVSISLSDFDTHSDNFPRMRHLLPILDHGLTALVEDLESRGLLDDVAIVAWGEFGRTPKIDGKTGGRHHWPEVGPALLAGGGFRTGQVIGATDRWAGTAVERPVHYQDVLATLYHHLGIDAARTTVPDPTGRPQYLLEHGTPIAEVV